MKENCDIYAISDLVKNPALRLKKSRQEYTI